MTAVLERYRRLLALAAVIEQALVVLLILNIVVNIGTQVFSRYLFGQPLIWVEELATYSLIWATFLGASLGLKHGRHVKIQTFVGRLPARARSLFRGLVYLVMLALCLVLMRESWTVMEIEGRRSSISLPVDLPVSLFFSVPLFVGVTSMAATLLYLIAAELRVIGGGAPLEPIIARAAREPDPGPERTGEA